MFAPAAHDTRKRPLDLRSNDGSTLQERSSFRGWCRDPESQEFASRLIGHRLDEALDSRAHPLVDYLVMSLRDADGALLAAANAEVHRLGGCCGLAGNFEVDKGHYDVPVAVAEYQLLPTVRAAPGDAVILADGYSCRTSWPI